MKVHYVINKARLLHYLRNLADKFNCIYQYSYIGITTAEKFLGYN